MTSHNTFHPVIHRDLSGNHSDVIRNSTLLSLKTSLPLDSHLTKRNNHMFIYGTDQKALRENFIKPIILQGNTSYIIHDATGELLQ